MIEKREQLAHDIGTINAAYMAAEDRSVKVILNNTFHSMCNRAIELDKSIEDIINTVN